jgi:hypothetical protein
LPYIKGYHPSQLPTQPLAPRERDSGR